MLLKNEYNVKVNNLLSKIICMAKIRILFDELMLDGDKVMKSLNYCWWWNFLTGSAVNTYLGIQHGNFPGKTLRVETYFGFVD